MALIATLIFIGLVLVFAEVLFIPGVGVVGILGILSLAGSCVYAFLEFGSTVGAVTTAVNVVLIAVMAVYVLRAKTWKRFTLDTNIDAKATSQDEEKLEVGDRGHTIARLAPTGTVRFGEIVCEAKALEGMIDPDVDVEIVLIEDNKVYVRLLSEDF